MDVRYFLKGSSIKKQFTLGKQERLKSRKIIEQLFGEGKSLVIFPFQLHYMFIKNSGAASQAGFAAPSKNFKKAVDRNRIKRLMREAYRLQKQDLHTLLTQYNFQLAIFFIYTGKELPNYKLVSGKISLCLQGLVKIVHESIPSHS